MVGGEVLHSTRAAQFPAWELGRALGRVGKNINP